MFLKNLYPLSAALGGLCLTMGSAIASDQPQPAAPVVGATAPAIVPVAPAVPESADHEAFTAMGYMVAKQMRMNVGFDEQQLAWICEGFKAGASEAAIPENYREDLHRAEMIYRGHTMKMAEKQKEIADENMKLGEAYIESLPNKDKLTKTTSGLYYEILTPGNPEKMPSNADRVKVNYVGSLTDGSVFDKSTSPVEFNVAGVVPGFSEGLKLIGEGGKIRLYIPGNLGYGMQPPPNSPMKPGSMLIFEAEMVEVTKAPAKTFNQPTALEDNERPIRRVRRDTSATPPPPPNMTPPPLPPEILEQLKNPPKTPPPPPPAGAAPSQKSEAPTAKE
jgi:FKBP-type peptidyl-prolyl cis-trans isomerase